jgi:hypothetical protein
MLLDDKEKNKMRSKFESVIEERKKKRNKHTSTAQEEEIESLRNEINELKNVINLLITEKKEE